MPFLSIGMEHTDYLLNRLENSRNIIFLSIGTAHTSIASKAQEIELDMKELVSSSSTHLCPCLSLVRKSMRTVREIELDTKAFHWKGRH
jgi:hypothetical protein